MKPAILFVDDQNNILQSLRRSLRGLDKEWDIHYANGGSEALNTMRQHEIHIVVSDTNMPGMRGTELLTEVRSQYPNTIRLVLSGGCRNDDISLLLRTSHQFFPKPFDIQKLRETVEHLLVLKGNIKEKRIQSILASVSKLPCAPYTHGHFYEEIDGFTPNLEKIGQYISQDMGLATKLLQSLNSTYFGVNKSGIHPHQAVKVMGPGTISHLFVDSMRFDPIESQSDNYNFVKDIYKYSYQTALAAQKIARSQNMSEEAQDHAYTAGLLSDIGLVILATELADEFKAISDSLTMSTPAQLTVEAEAFGNDHCDISAYFLGLWGFPIDIVEAVRGHQKPNIDEGNAFSLISVAHIAQALIYAKGDRATFENMLDMEYINKIGKADQIDSWFGLYDHIISSDDVKNWVFAAEEVPA